MVLQAHVGSSYNSRASNRVINLRLSNRLPAKLFTCRHDRYAALLLENAQHQIRALAQVLIPWIVPCALQGGQGQQAAEPLPDQALERTGCAAQHSSADPACSLWRFAATFPAKPYHPYYHIISSILDAHTNEELKALAVIPNQRQLLSWIRSAGLSTSLTLRADQYQSRSHMTC